MVKLDFDFIPSDLTLDHSFVILLGGYVVYLLVNVLYQLYFSPLSKIPGPWYTAVSRIWLTCHTFAGRRIFAVHNLHQKYGPVVRISPTEIAISDIEAVKQIHSQQDPYRKSDWYSGLTGDLNAVFGLVHNDTHKARRRAWGTAWSHTNMTAMEPVIRKHVYTCVEKIKREIEGGRRVDLLAWMQFMTTDIISEISYGRDMGMLAKEMVNPLVQDLLAITVVGGIRAEFPSLQTVQKILSYIPHPTIQWFVNCDHRLESHGDKALSDLRREVQDCKDKSGNPRASLFTKLLDDVDNPSAKHKMTMEEIRHEAINNMIVGSDTVTVTGTYMLWAIYRHNEVREKLERELKDAGVAGGEITDEKCQNLVYLTAVIKEALRLYSAAPMGLPRVVPDGGRLLAGYFFPQGVNVTSQAYTLHRNPKIFEDPYAFKPERWLSPTKVMENYMMPWGGQTRSCLGQHLAMMELRLLAVVMLTLCPNAGLARTCTDESMEFENYFIIKPRSHRCDLERVDK
ncbi:hypothetical protein TWF694_004769 [Orbilia ellipsospora]|uniref:Cytochrome P450 n=1 Tax=Orbilia ellipsospora TaxID=2528407 RepID=A0AAV9X293_9PEZI